MSTNSQIYLTDKGRSIAKQAPPIVAEYNKKLMDKFTASEIEVVHKFLDTIIEDYIWILQNKKTLRGLFINSNF